MVNKIAPANWPHRGSLPSGTQQLTLKSGIPTRHLDGLSTPATCFVQATSGTPARESPVFQCVASSLRVIFNII